MVERLRQLMIVSLAAAATLTVASPARAQEVDYEDYPTVLEELDSTFFNNSGDYYRNTGFLGTLVWLFGPFPENNIARDTQAYMNLVDELLELQNTEPPIRTPNLPTPFENSLLTLPPYEPPVPAPAPAFVPPAVNPPAPPPAAPAAPPEPVRGLY